MPPTARLSRCRRYGVIYQIQTKYPGPKQPAGSDGRFSVRLPQPEGDGPAEGYMAMYPWLVASAPGHGVGWCERALRPDRPAEQVVTLVEEGPPIEGRIVDLEGRPVVGASVQAARIWYDEKGNIAGWIAKARNGAAGNLWQGLQSLTLDAILPQLGRVLRGTAVLDRHQYRRRRPVQAGRIRP